MATNIERATKRAMADRVRQALSTPTSDPDVFTEVFTSVPFTSTPTDVVLRAGLEEARRKGVKKEGVRPLKTMQDFISQVEQSVKTGELPEPEPKPVEEEEEPETINEKKKLLAFNLLKAATSVLTDPSLQREPVVGQKLLADTLGAELAAVTGVPQSFQQSAVRTDEPKSAEDIILALTGLAGKESGSLLNAIKGLDRKSAGSARQDLAQAKALGDAKSSLMSFIDEMRAEGMSDDEIKNFFETTGQLQEVEELLSV